MAITRFPGRDLSLGLHVCLQGRIDIHVAVWMISIGRVPMYSLGGKITAASNSFHNDRSKLKTTLRAGSTL